MSHVIIGTAGHVDHGKTALIKALTGEDTDRLHEEKERGISIELGFAPFKLPSERLAGVIDVPGHERFIHNMLAGIGGIDLVLLVVDVTEGVMPQTREHVEIMDLLHIPRGLVVLAKIDLVEDVDWLDLVEEEVREALAGTFLAQAPYYRVSAHTRQGLPELLQAIDELTADIENRDEKAPLRLPVDRVFTVPGFGTIATGTLLAGTIHLGSTVQVLPLGRTARVRQIQVHGAQVESAAAGQRTAVNLSGLEKEALPRGSVIAALDSLEATYLIDAKLKLLASAPRAMKNLTRVHLYLGTGRAVGRVALLDRDELKQGEEAPVQLRLERKLVAQRHDRFIIRSFSPMTTIGGGLVLDARPSKHKRFKNDILHKLKELEKGDPAAPILQRIRREGAVAHSLLLKESGLAPEVLQTELSKLLTDGKIKQVGELYVDALAAQEWSERLEQVLTEYHQAYHLAVGMSRAALKKTLPQQVTPKLYDWLLTTLVTAERLRLYEDLVALAAHHPQPSEKETKQITALTELIKSGGFMPPTSKEAAAKLVLTTAQIETYLSYIAQQGLLVRLDEQLALHQEFFQQAKEVLCQHFRAHQTLTTGEFREKLNTTRKYVIPLLEKFDHLKWTRRLRDERVAWRLDITDCGEDGKDD
ncbi:MAG TPA: selenocysteine-specific translation elongation factor [Oscillospiraceae bacterium]|nr:selenocysteine-specific translation elongation factor [Oscillospiraceae bacterium]